MADINQIKIGNETHDITAHHFVDPITIQLTGGVAGSASFDGSASFSISTTIDEDEHSHDERYYTESEIDSKIATLNSSISGVNNKITTFLKDAAISDAAVDTLLEIQTYISNDQSGAASMLSSINANTTNLSNHISNKSNPHGVTCAQVGALPLTGGTLTGTVNSSGNFNLYGSNSYISLGISSTGAKCYFQTYNPVSQGVDDGNLQAGFGFGWEESLVIDKSGNVFVPGDIHIGDEDSIGNGNLSLQPMSGEGGQILLNASKSDKTNNGICIDTANGDFRVFGLPSSDGTSKTGNGTVLNIDPYTATITGGYSFDGNAATATKVNNNIVIKLNGGTTENSNMFTFNGSAGKSINITPSSIGLGNVNNTADANKSVNYANSAGTANSANTLTNAEAGVLKWEGDHFLTSASRPDAKLHFGASDLYKYNGSYYVILDQGNFKSYVTPSSIGAVAKAGDTMTGNLNMGANSVIFGSCTVKYDSINECLNFAFA